MYVCQWSLFWIKKGVFLTCLRFLKKSVLKLLDHTVYVPGYDWHNLCSHYWYIWHTIDTCWYLPPDGNSTLVQILVTCPFHTDGRWLWHMLIHQQSFFTYQISYGLFIIHRQTSILCVCVCVCVWPVSIIHIPWPSTQIVRTESQWPG